MDHISNTIDDFTLKVENERRLFSSDARAMGNAAIASKIAKDDGGLITTLSVAIHHAGFVEPYLDEESKTFLIRSLPASEAYERWNWSDIALVGSQCLIAAAATEHLDPKYLSVTLCTPSIVSVTDREIFAADMNIIYENKGDFAHDPASPLPLCHGDISRIPKWAQVLAASNSLRAIANKALASPMFDIADDAIEPIDRRAIVQALMRHTGIGEAYGGWLGFGNVHKPPARWREEALSRVGLSISDSDDIRKAAGVVEIWQRLCARGSRRIPLSAQELSDGTAATKIEKLGDVLGIDVYVEAYLKGIPIDDLIHPTQSPRRK